MPIKIGNRLLGLGTWALVTLPIWGALLAPLVLAWAILLFNTYWFLRSASLAVGAALGYMRLRRPSGSIGGHAPPHCPDTNAFIT